MSQRTPTVPITLVYQLGVSMGMCVCGHGYIAKGDEIEAADAEFNKHLDECPDAKRYDEAVKGIAREDVTYGNGAFNPKAFSG